MVGIVWIVARRFLMPAPAQGGPSSAMSEVCRATGSAWILGLPAPPLLSNDLLQQSVDVLLDGGSDFSLPNRCSVCHRPQLATLVQ